MTPELPSITIYWTTAVNILEFALEQRFWSRDFRLNHILKINAVIFVSLLDNSLCTCPLMLSHLAERMKCKILAWYWHRRSALVCPLALKFLMSWYISATVNSTLGQIRAQIFIPWTAFDSKPDESSVTSQRFLWIVICESSFVILLNSMRKPGLVTDGHCECDPLSIRCEPMILPTLNTVPYLDSSSWHMRGEPLVTNSTKFPITGHPTGPVHENNAFDWTSTRLFSIWKQRRQPVI